MFTGIIEATGKVAAASEDSIEILCGLERLKVGESISVSGVCLTVTSCDGGRFGADLSEETVRRTSLGAALTGARVNLERAMPASGRFGGHIVQGHVDAVTSILAREDLPGSSRFWFATPPDLGPFLVEKGAVAIEGVSLTVSSTDDDRFCVDVIPHTLSETNFADKLSGDRVNLEVDIVAKYVNKLMRAAGGRP